MNKQQSMIFSIVMVAIIVACTYPPWVFTFQAGAVAKTKIPAGYGLIFSPPTPKHWRVVEGAAKNDSGEYQVLVGGKWQPVASAAKNGAGQYMALMEDNKNDVFKRGVEIDTERLLIEIVIALAIGSIAGVFTGKKQNLPAAQHHKDLST